MKFFIEGERSAECGHVYVRKATVLQPHSYGFVKSKLRNKSLKSDAYMLFSGRDDDESIETHDMVLSNITSKCFDVPVANISSQTTDSLKERTSL